MYNELQEYKQWNEVFCLFPWTSQLNSGDDYGGGGSGGGDDDDDDDDDDLGDLLKEYIMSPCRQSQNTRHYDVTVLPFVTTWETSRRRDLNGDVLQ